METAGSNPDPNKDKPKDPVVEKPKTENEMFFPEDEYRKAQPGPQSPRDASVGGYRTNTSLRTCDRPPLFKRYR